MPITIWQPRGYVDGFAYDGTLPINGDALPAPFDRDTKVREITRFTGSKTTYFCNTGSFQIVTDQATPADIQKGYLVEIEGEHFVIEDISWKRDSGGYTCTFSGRDFWRFPESQIAHRWIGESYNIIASDDVFTGETLAQAVADWFTRMAAGWWRDRLRFPRAAAGTERQDWANIVRFDLAQTTQEAVLASQVSTLCNEIMSYASEWRLFCSWFGLGLRFGFTFNDDAGVYEIDPVLYDGQDSGITINTRSRGVSDFEYQENTRGTINAAYCMLESNYTYTPANGLAYVQDDYSGTITNHGEDAAYRSFCLGIKDGAASFSERARFFGEAYLDAGQPQDGASASASALRAWIKEQSESGMVADEKAFSFSYDGLGVYKYGVHFGLGDYITIVDDYLGIESKQQLTGVTTSYEAGQFRKYAFEFGSQRIRRTDALKRRFSEINRRTYGAGKRA